MEVNSLRQAAPGLVDSLGIPSPPSGTTQPPQTGNTPKNDKAREFLEWCATNLDKDNILTEHELAQYEAIKVSGQFLEGDALTEELKALESYFPGILTLDEKEIEQKERELNFLNADTTSRTDRIDRMKKTEEIEKKRIAEDYQQKLLTEECVAKAKEVDEIKKSNLQKMDELRKSYIEPVRTCK